MGAWEAFTMNVLFIGLLLLISAGFYLSYLIINILIEKRKNMRNIIEISLEDYDLIESSGTKVIFRKKDANITDK